MSEKAILNETLVAVSALPETLVYRNNTGQAWQGRRLSARVGQTVVVRPGMTILQDARPINFGLEGSGDIMGAHRARPLAIEAKDEGGGQSAVQVAFQRAWERVGGIYLLVKSAEEALKKLTLI